MNLFKLWLFTWTGPGVTLHDFVVPLFPVLEEPSRWSPSCLIPIWNPQIRVGWCRTSPCSRVHLLFAFFFMMPILSLGKSHLIRALICSPLTISNRDVELPFLCFFLKFFYCSGFCHTLKWNSHRFTCVPHPDPPSHLPLHPIPLGLPSAPGPSACLMHPTWAGDLFHPR